MCHDRDRSETCLGYIRGVVDALQTTAEIGGSKWGACVIGVTVVQMRDITIGRLSTLPADQRDGTASAMLLTPLSEPSRAHQFRRLHRININVRRAVPWLAYSFRRWHAASKYCCDRAHRP